ncbi:sugar kinase [Faecalicatena sp. AGMB00832]|uniref:Sugar kinase n=1 Tax=Faecalicatena faecalis TaxID=2726362 RepID=A0ABS6D0R4_9FIRM|nr:sugar kinase [Faecalicatena faecalis]MBU3875173.1 sugar kinase [Faecalicatena faecalis]
MENKELDVLCAGLALVNFPIHPIDESVFQNDINMVSPISLMPGGDAANQAIILSRLGMRTALLSVVGDDGFGTMLLSMMREQGRDVDVSHVAVERGNTTGVAAMLVQPDGQRNFCINRGGLLEFGLKHIEMDLLDRTRLVSIGGLMSLPGFDGEGTEEFFRKAKQAGAITMADTKKDLWGIGLDGIRGTLAYTDYFFPSLEEAQAISKADTIEKMAEIFLQCGAAHVGIKLGADGCYFKDDEQEFYLPAYPCDVVDTTGSGDNFMAGFITGLLSGWEVKTSCKFASAAGAVNAAAIGPNSAVTSKEQILKFMSEHKGEGRI